MTRRPRVLLVGPMPPTKGGVTTFMLNLMASTLAEQVAFVPFTTARPPKRDVMDNYGYGAMLKGGWRRILQGAAVTLWHVLIFPRAALTAEIVQIQASDYQVFWEAAAYAAMARVLRRRVVMRIGGAFDGFHGGAGRWERWLIAQVLRLPHAVIAQSRFAERVLRGAGRTGEIVLLPNWSRDLPDVPKRAGEPCCLFIAGLEARRKGVADVLEAARRLPQLRFELLAVTPGLAEEIAALALPHVSVRGPLSHPDVLAAMQRAAIFLLPSHGEGFPNSLVEAMAAGMACIATPVGAVPEMAEGGAVRLVAAGDSAALAAAIAELAASPKLRAELGARARERVSRRYTQQAALPALAGLYDRLAPGMRGHRPPAKAVPNAAMPDGPAPAGSPRPP